MKFYLAGRTVHPEHTRSERLRQCKGLIVSRGDLRRVKEHIVHHGDVFPSPVGG